MRKNIQYTLYIFLGIFVIMFLCWCCNKPETFANKNKRTFLDVDGNILGFDMIDHNDTFDYEHVVTELPMPDMTQ
uniref:Uncharacterized protein n=1 Tax=viral metagenome TaxID=1070528 RepID=A0A6C0HTX4_9ZZZZ